MRVLYFTRDYTPHDHRFLTALAESEHEVFSLRLERSGPQREDRPLPERVTQVRWQGGLRPFRLRDGPALLADLKRVLRKVQPDLVHAGPVQSAGLLAALAGFHPLALMSWGSDLLKDADRSAGMRWATRTALSQADGLLGDCAAVRDKAVLFGFPAERVTLFPWGVDLERFAPEPKPADHAARERTGWQGCFTILCNRSWEPVYGVATVARAFVEAYRQRPDLRLFLLGTGSLAGEIRSILTAGGALEAVHFGGQVAQADLPGYYRAADLYVSASYSDGSSVSLMEALACGRPALVSDIPGNREWITPGEAGWLFPAGDAAALAQGLLRAADLPVEERAAMGLCARALAEERADWQKNKQKLFQAYELAVQAARGGRRGTHR